MLKYKKFLNKLQFLLLFSFAMLVVLTHKTYTVTTNRRAQTTKWTQILPNTSRIPSLTLPSGQTVKLDRYSPESTTIKKIMFCMPISTRRQFYAENTLRWILRLLKDDCDCVFVAIIFDNDESKAIWLRELFKREIDVGLFEVLMSNEQNYATLNMSRLTTVEAWMSKMNYDFAFAMTYCKHHAHNCVWLEDDVIPDIYFYSSTIQQIVNIYSSDERVSFGSFCNLGSVAQVPNNDYMDDIIQFFYDHAQSMPTDWLMDNYTDERGLKRLQFEVLFDHYGFSSSNKYRLQDLRSYPQNPSLSKVFVSPCLLTEPGVDPRDCQDLNTLKQRYFVANNSKFDFELEYHSVLERIFIYLYYDDDIPADSELQVYSEDKDLLITSSHRGAIEMFPYKLPPIKYVTVTLHNISVKAEINVAIDFLRWFK